jgi:hypothetical protein
LSGYQLLGVPAEHVDAVWPLVERFIERALDFGNGEYLAEDIRKACLERDMQLFVGGTGSGITGAGATQVVTYPRAKYLDLVLWASDAPFEEFGPSLLEIEKWAETLGARPRLFGRDGWRKKLAGYRRAYTVFVRTP